MTTLKDISDTYDLEELNANVSAWMKQHTPNVADVNMYLIRLKTLTHLVNFSDNSAVVQIFEALAGQLSGQQRQDLIRKILDTPSREENITFLSAISDDSPAAGRVLLAAWENTDTGAITPVLNIFDKHPEYRNVLFSSVFLQSPDYIAYLRRTPPHMFQLLSDPEITDRALATLRDNDLINEELLFPLLAVARQSYGSSQPWTEIWQRLFPEYVADEAARIAGYLPSGQSLEKFVAQVTLNPRQQWKILLEWVGRPDGQPFSKEFCNLMQNFEWTERSFGVFFNAYMIGQKGQHDLAHFSVLWATNTPEHLHQYLYQHLKNCKPFSQSQDWVRQKVILQHETDHPSSKKSQRKM